MGPLPFANLDLLDPPPQAFSYRKALYENNWSSGGAPEEEGREEFGGIHKLELLEKVVEVEDQIYATTYWLAQAFAAKSVPWEFWDVIPPYLHAFKDVSSKASFNLLPKCKQWDYAINLLPNSMPTSCKVYLLVPREQDKLDTFLQDNLDFSD
ncbi:hypothetical protein C0989_002740 [Termitomyces sp. Mn162]|nr:hypothetical protein C0989_002740 [Termitomyces sp. Mn162]